jgi:hypothetical protein
MLSCLVLMVIMTLNLSEGHALPQQWNVEETGCTPVENNEGVTLPNVYLGVGGTVPPEISNEYSGASASYLEDWKTGMVGLGLNQLETIKIDKSRAYTNPEAPLYNKDLYFDVTIVNIHNGGSITTRNSVVDVLYTLYTGCGTKSSSPFVGGTPENWLLIGAGVISVVGLLGILGKLYLQSQNQIVSEETIQKTSERQDAKIQSLKEALSEQEARTKRPDKEIAASKTSRTSSTRRRRR